MTTAGAHLVVTNLVPDGVRRRLLAHAETHRFTPPTRAAVGRSPCPAWRAPIQLTEPRGSPEVGATGVE